MGCHAVSAEHKLYFRSSIKPWGTTENLRSKKKGQLQVSYPSHPLHQRNKSPHTTITTEFFVLVLWAQFNIFLITVPCNYFHKSSSSSWHLHSFPKRNLWKIPIYLDDYLISSTSSHPMDRCINTTKKTCFKKKKSPALHMKTPVYCCRNNGDNTA